MRESALERAWGAENVRARAVNATWTVPNCYNLMVYVMRGDRRREDVDVFPDAGS